MNEPSKWSGLCAVAGPIVRAKVIQLAVRHRLQRCDRDDLEQEIYLTLLAGCVANGPSVSVRGEPSVDGLPGRPRDDGRPVEDHAHLAREVDRLAESLVRGWPSWRRERRLPPSAAAVRAARPSSGRPDAHDLRLDLTRALARLPDGLRERCCRLLLADITTAVDIRTQQPDGIAPAELSSIVAVLRPLFTSLDLHHYL